MLITVVAVIVAVVMAGVGAAGAATGWVPSWTGRPVLRPRLLGWATLLSAAGFSLFIFLGPLAHSYGPLPWIGWAAFMTGLVLQSYARRPGLLPFRRPGQ
ncbi:hypothetical protein WN71_026725 [Streptomyces mangrovisoli]|uniref:Uncharacterized protein n=2 Tax=Streptomyces mangrovisoli TaxID=1428628 RepID=A0A1J4NTL9_9ACTN|nr:hypothetical protein WN71_026725 [Streptomyces mangrovisoli]